MTYTFFTLNILRNRWLKVVGLALIHLALQIICQEIIYANNIFL